MRLKARFRKLRKSVNHRKLSVAFLIGFSSALMVFFNNCGSKFDTGVRPGETNSSSFSSDDPGPAPAPAPSPSPEPIGMPDPMEPPVLPPPTVDPLPGPVVSPPPVVSNPPAPNNPPVVDEGGAVLPQEPTGRCLPAASLIKLCSGGLCIRPVQSMSENGRCYTSSDGRLKCSGTNTNGQVGDGSNQVRATAVPVDSGAIYAKLSSNDSYTCGLTRDCTIKCWGAGLTYILGQSGSSTPSPLDAATAYIDIAVSSDLTCGLTTAGVIKCWGNNSYVLGATGNLSAITVSEPGIKYKKLSPSVGSGHFCAISENGMLKCWGRNNQGQLGIGSLENASVPTLADNGIAYFSVITIGSTSYGITSMGELKFWGLPNDGATYGGDWSTQTPTAFDPGTRYTSLAASSRINCGITDSGTLKCWGSTFGTTISSGLFAKTPTVVDANFRFVSVATNRGAVCGITTTGLTRCLGDSTNGIFGGGELGFALSPVSAPAFGEVSAVSLGTAQSCKLSLSGELACVGGTGTGAISTQFKNLDAGVAYHRISAGDQYGCGITSDKVLKCWGNNSRGALGAGAITSLPVPAVIDAGTTYSDVSALSDGSLFAHTCGVTSAGVLKCWGYNSNGQLGDGTSVDQRVPTVIDPGVSYISVSVSANHSCGITSRFEKKCWGLTYGKSPVLQSTPALEDYKLITGNFILGHSGKVYGGSQFSDLALNISSNSSRTCAVTNQGMVKCWGASPIGDGTLSGYQNVPIQVDSAVYKNISVGIKTTCGVLSSNTVKCWGSLNGSIAGLPATWIASTPITVNAP